MHKKTRHLALDPSPEQIQLGVPDPNCASLELMGLGRKRRQSLQHPTEDAIHQLTLQLMSLALSRQATSCC